MAKIGLSGCLLLSSFFLLEGCGGYGSTGACQITAVITPPNASADHSAVPPGNQAQFSLQSSVSGNCPYIADKLGTWSTSDPANTTISNQGLATCVNATATPATISNSGTVRGHAYASATLTCQ
jgi:hypothetical protein